MTERWLPVVGYEGFYEVSDQGRVRRIARGNGTNPGRMLTGSPTPKGHIKVGLSRGGVRTFAYVHRLVLAAFVGPAPEGTEGCHGDGNPENNTVSNLRWDTQSANGLDRVKHGTHHLARRTRCPRGHEFDGERDGYRTCSECRHINDRARRGRARTHQEESMSDQITPEPSAEDQGAAASCHLCVGAGGYEDHDGEWVECSCQRAEPQGEPSDAQVDTVAAAIAKAANADYWTDEIAEWETAEAWECEAHPDEHPHAAYEDRDEFRRQARAALRAASAVEREA